MTTSWTGRGGLPPRRPDQASPSTSPAMSPGSGPTVTARVVIISGPGEALYVYSGPPAFGDLIASIVSAAGEDPYGNPVLPIIRAYGSDGSSVGLVDGPPAALVLATGDPDQVDNGIWLTSIVGSGTARQLGVYGQSPTLSLGADAGSHGTVELYSASPDGTEAATATIAATGAPGVASFAALNLLAATAGGTKSFAELSSESEVWLRTDGAVLLAPNGITAVEPGTTATPETPHPLTLATPGNWTVVTQPTYQYMPDGTVSIEGELTSTAAITAGATLATLPAGWAPSATRRLTWCANSGSTTVDVVLASVGSGGIIQTFPAIASGFTLNISSRFRV